jgi:hypothetical protein
MEILRHCSVNHAYQCLYLGGGEDDSDDDKEEEVDRKLKELKVKVNWSIHR